MKYQDLSTIQAKQLIVMIKVLYRRPMTAVIDEFMQALLSLDRLTAEKLLEENTRQISPIKFIEDVVVVVLERIGREWQKGNIALSQVYMGGRICEELVDAVLPPGAPDRKGQPKMAICVLCDHHGLGKSIVYSLLRASGFELLDFGTMGVDELAVRIEKEKVAILLISVLMLPSALRVKEVKKRLSERRLNVKIVVGGAPFRLDRRLWKDVGADAMCETASESVAAIEYIMGDAK
jgi:methanogenic corrinoid protein MtbC1